jgi:hypothetical protein
MYSLKELPPVLDQYDVDKYMNRGGRLFRRASLSSARIAFTLLIIPVALLAQSGVCQPFGYEISSKCAELQDIHRFNPKGARLSFDYPTTFTCAKPEIDAAEKSDDSLFLTPFAASSYLYIATTFCSEWLQLRKPVVSLDQGEPAENGDIPDPVSKRPVPNSKTATFMNPFTNAHVWSFVPMPPPGVIGTPMRVANTDNPSKDSKPASPLLKQKSGHIDFNQNIFYKNRLEFSLDGGWLPINIPFVFDVFLGDGYTMTSLRYTLVPLIVSLRWQMDGVGGPWIFRGNWELEASGAVTLIPRGPETRYFAWIMGIRRNFVPRRGRFAPYFDGRLGLGDINAKEPLGVLYAQGQDFTFTVNMGSGVRYGINSRYSISAGLNWMHISNLYLSQPQFSNYGINVYGPMLGFNIRLGKPRYQGSE